MNIRIQVTRKHDGTARVESGEYSLDLEAPDFHDAVWQAKEELLSHFEFKSLGAIRKK